MKNFADGVRGYLFQGRVGWWVLGKTHFLLLHGRWGLAFHCKVSLPAHQNQSIGEGNMNDCLRHRGALENGCSNIKVRRNVRLA
jgi:hypothetical protein